MFDYLVFFMLMNMIYQKDPFKSAFCFVLTVFLLLLSFSLNFSSLIFFLLGLLFMSGVLLLMVYCSSFLFIKTFKINFLVFFVSFYLFYKKFYFVNLNMLSVLNYINMYDFFFILLVFFLLLVFLNLIMNLMGALRSF